jgi:hypothetical protein
MQGTIFFLPFLRGEHRIIAALRVQCAFRGDAVSALGIMSSSITRGVRAIDRAGFHVHYVC